MARETVAQAVGLGHRFLQRSGESASDMPISLSWGMIIVVILSFHGTKSSDVLQLPNEQREI
ncbi:hypothetical protein [Phenylobacterium sp.]|uniref:hypothetical protein n=1 Tax=Phenylobacterium sp. TaxID=1871053 RepID=UPI002F3FDB96